MAYKTYKTFRTKKTPQSQPIPGSKQVKNNAGGYTWELDKWGKLDRFLVLGTEGGTYYVNERKHTMTAGENLLSCIESDGLRTVRRVAEISHEGRAAKNDPAIFALAACAKLGDDKTRKAAFEALPVVCRIGTHLFHFADYCDNFGGWGRAQRRAVAKWYTDKDPGRAAFQAVKYQQRDGWSNRDLLRLSHPSAPSEGHQALFKWIVKGDVTDGLPQIVHSFEQAKWATDERKIVGLIHEAGLTREMVPTRWLNSVAVWDALLHRMPLHAVVRNLGKMTSIGLVKPLSEASKHIARKLSDEIALRDSRMHPVSVLGAMMTYGSGRGVRGSLTWSPDRRIMDALDKAFYKSFKFVPSTGKRIVLALDVSGSMSWHNLMNVPGLTPRVASAALSLVTANTEHNYATLAFTAPGGKYGYGRKAADAQRRCEGISELSISPRQRLDDVLKTVDKLPMGATDCALPMLWAMKNNIEVDAFVIYTDNETWAGKIHPHQALVEYRQKTGIPAKLIPVGMEATDYTIGNPDDSGTLNVAGFDSATPQIISNFISS